jgi:hypothetical protein
MTRAYNVIDADGHILEPLQPPTRGASNGSLE